MMSGHTYSPTISSDENYIYTMIISRENIITEILTEIVIKMMIHKMMEIMILMRQVMELMESELLTIFGFADNEIIKSVYKENYYSMVKINIRYGFIKFNYCQSC